MTEMKGNWGGEVVIDILICVAGMTRFNTVEAEDENLRDWWRVFSVNIFGTVQFVRAGLLGMLKRKSGVIVSFASTNGSLDIPFNTAYASSKAAIIRFNQDLDIELQGTGVSCFALHPEA